MKRPGADVAEVLPEALGQTIILTRSIAHAPARKSVLAWECWPGCVVANG